MTIKNLNNNKKGLPMSVSIIMKNMVPVKQLSNNKSQGCGLNLISVIAIKYPDKKQIWGKRFIQLTIPL